MKNLIRLIAILALLATTLTIIPSVEAATAKGCLKRNNDTVAKVLECVTLNGVRGHQRALQDIADDNDGTRAAGTSGYDDSVDYVAGKLQAAGYNVTRHEFDFTYVEIPTVQQSAPTTGDYEAGQFSGTGYGDVTADVTAVDINLVPPRAETSGCDGAFTEAAVGAPILADPAGVDDFAGFTPGDIALIQRGGCSFALKGLNAEAAGAAGLIIFNQCNSPDRCASFSGNAIPPAGSADTTIGIPMAGISFADGEKFAVAGAIGRVKVAPPVEMTQENVIAESRFGDPNHVVMAGAHLDSVQQGPGINDNGSGSSAILEVALQMAKTRTASKLRFAWWGGEESGLVGSTAYVADLSQAERDKIDLYLNFDMIGSPNYTFGIYDGDNSDGVGEGPGPEGSAEIEALFEDFYTSRDEPFKGTDFSGRSDYGPFIEEGVDIPAGGLFTGAEVLKTAEEAAIWGGTAGVALDPCYHQARDTFANNSNHALEVNSDAVAFAVATLAGVPAEDDEQ
jgi:hypothetical protein